MKYYYIDVEAGSGRPKIKKLKANGYRRKNGKDQVFVKIVDKYEWIYATIVKEY